MAKINLFGNAHQHSCVYTIDLKISSDIEVLIKIPTQAHYVPTPVRMGDDKISNILIISGPCGVGDKNSDGKGRNYT